MTVGEHIYKILNRPSTGFYVDVGAYDGVSNDETIFLEQNGWDGICIEGHPIIFDILKENRKCQSYKAFIGKEDNSTRDIIYLESSNLGTAIVDNLPSDHLHVLKNNTPDYQIHPTKIRHLESVLDELNAPKEIELLKLDTEGTCFEILQSLSYEKYHFKIISAELGKPGVEHSNFDKGLLFLKDRGYYHISSYNQNNIFIHKSLLYIIPNINEHIFTF